MPQNNERMPQQSMQARFVPQSVTRTDEATTATLTWSTGAQVRRYDWWEDREFIEELSMEPDSVDLTRLNNGAPFLRDHQQSVDSVIGVVERAWLDNGEGKATVRFSDRDDVAAIVKDVEQGILRNISVGYVVREFEKIVPADKNELPIYRATDWQPMEVSLVAIPADAAAQIRGSAELYPVTIRGDKMADPVNPDSAPAQTEPVKVVDTAAIERKAAQAERDRISAIRTFAGTSNTPADMVETLIADGVSIQGAKERMIEAWQQRAEPIVRADVTVTVDEADKRVEAAVNAIMGKAGMLSSQERQAKLQGNPFVGLRMLDIARDSAERAGVRVTGMSQMEIVGRAFTQSTSDFPVLLENTMHKTLLAAYAKTADSWRRFCKTGSVSDFRAWKRIKTGSIGNLDTINELGEFVNKTIPDGEAESVQATTSGNIVGVSRQAIINDDLSYFVGLTADLGRAAARTIESAVYAKLVANPTMGDGVALFHADHGNLAGSGAAPTVATIDAGRQAMAIQTDVSGNDYLDIRPSIALCPVSLGGELRVLNSAEYDVDKAPGSTSGKNIYTPNRVRGLFADIVDSPRLSGTAWYMVADPMDAPALEVVFLDGNETPYLEMQDGFSVDGVRYKVRLDFGVGVVDYRGIYKNAGG